MEKFIKELKENKIVIIVILLTVIVSLLFNNYLKKDYSRVNNDTTDFVSGKVVEVTSSEVEYDEELKLELRLLFRLTNLMELMRIIQFIILIVV